MTPRRTYYINYIDPRTGFLKREEFDSHRDQMNRVDELKRQGVMYISHNHFEV